MLEERMQLLSLLWAAGVRAETMHVASPTSAAQYDYAKQKGMLYLITIESSTHIDVVDSSVTVRAAASHVVMLLAALASAALHREPWPITKARPDWCTRSRLWPSVLPTNILYPTETWGGT